MKLDDALIRLPLEYEWETSNSIDVRDACGDVIFSIILDDDEADDKLAEARIKAIVDLVNHAGKCKQPGFKK